MPGRTVPSASSHLPKPVPGGPIRSTSPSTGSAGSRYSGGSHASTTSPPYLPPSVATGNAGHGPNRISEPHRQDAAQLAARGEAELGEYAAQVVSEGARDRNSRAPISGFDIARRRCNCDDRRGFRRY